MYFNQNLGAYFLTRYGDVESVLMGKDFRAPDSQWADQVKPGWRDRPASHFLHTSLLYRNGDDHTWMRRLLKTNIPPRADRTIHRYTQEPQNTWCSPCLMTT